MTTETQEEFEARVLVDALRVFEVVVNSAEDASYANRGTYAYEDVEAHHVEFGEAGDIRFYRFTIHGQKFIVRAFPYNTWFGLTDTTSDEQKARIDGNVVESMERREAEQEQMKQAEMKHMVGSTGKQGEPGTIIPFGRRSKTETIN